jgi:hypothetical protein
MSAHTPGPWTAIETPESSHHDWRIKATRLFIGVATDNSEADARLIAAAPELLEALEYLVSLGGGDCLEPARAAIAKAKGGAA